MIRTRQAAHAVNHPPFWLSARTVVLLLCVLTPYALAAQTSERTSVEGLSFQTVSTNIILMWPSDPRETFAVLWRPNAALETPWTLLSGQLRAASGTNQTTFRHAGALALVKPSADHSGPSELYRVLVIPDFWFDLEGVTLAGGPRNPGEDFLPFYYGTREVAFFKPGTELVVDGQSAGVASTLDEAVQRVNFGTANKPQWLYVAGFWFHHDEVADGEHTLQIHSSFLLNSSVGECSWSVTLTNRPLRVQVVSPRREQEGKGSEKLLANRRAQGQPSWWERRLGRGFVRRRPTPEDAARHFIYSEADDLPSQIRPRPWDPISPANANRESTP